MTKNDESLKNFLPDSIKELVNRFFYLTLIYHYKNELWYNLRAKSEEINKLKKFKKVEQAYIIMPFIIAKEIISLREERVKTFFT